MAEMLRHRGPDDDGAFVDPAAGLALGFRRLSILDLSQDGHQPMSSPSERYVIVFNGEIYNYRTLRTELEGSGHRWRGHSDTEVMLAGIERWGFTEAVRRFNGMFAIAVWDRHRRELHLARDRMGEKPMYYGWSGGVLLFGSELKALRAHPRFDAEIDRDALALYFRHNYINAPYSIYRGIFKLPPASIVTFSADRPGLLPQPRAFWSVRKAAEEGVRNLFPGSDAEAVEELDRLLRDAVKIRMEADVPLGAFLSGGIDSSTVVALMQAQSARPVKTFSIGFHEPGYDEAPFAKEVAAHLGTDHTELYVAPEEARAVIPLLPTLYDEPFSDSSQVPTFLVSRLARQQVTVSLSGDGGDELFGGYPRYVQAADAWRSLQRVPAAARRGGARALRIMPPAAWTAIARTLGPVLPARLRSRNPGDRLQKIAQVAGLRSAEELYRGMVSHWADPAAIVVGATEPRTELDDPARWARLPEFLDRMMYLDAVTYLPGDILAKLDRASMGVSLEGRVPLLDHRVVEFAWRIPHSLKMRRGEEKWILRQVLNRYVPRPLVDRPKMGFGIPVGEWLRGPLRPWGEDLLSSAALSEGGILRPAPIRQAWAEHLSGARDWQYRLWDVLVFQAWRRELTGRTAMSQRKPIEQSIS
jgi:asparagine synthase (glutamine-hydrolysing)